MKLLLLFIAAQLAGNGICLLLAALAARVLRRRLEAARPSIGSYTGSIGDYMGSSSVGSYVRPQVGSYASTHDPADDRYDAEQDIAMTIAQYGYGPGEKGAPC